MTKRLESKYKIDRRLGINLWGRPKSPINKRDYGPGQHGQRRKKPSDYGEQLMAKQRLKGYYGNIGERQFRRVYEEAARRKGDTGENLIGLLERRLDVVAYRAKFVPTVFAARQFVSHGHMGLLAARLRAMGVPCETLFIPYAQHAFDFVVGGFSDQILEAQLLKFLSSSGSK